ncbi:MAG TPA: alpha/beta fold hydrolase, partial [Ktedonobacterales bacterium]
KHGGDIYYNVAGPQDAEPLVLLHDFYPGASNYEFREIFQSLAGERRVYAPDWLGFGMSEHPHVAYTGEFYASVLTGFVRDVVARPATVLAHGRAANIAVRAASDTPGLFDRLILVSPYAHLGTGQEPTLVQTVVRGLQRVSLGIVPYAVVSTRPVLRWGANTRAAHVGEGVSSSESIDHSFASAHQFGGQHAMLALLTGALDLPMRNAFALLEPPALIVGGALDRIHPRTELEDLAVLNPHADLEIISDAGETPYSDQPDAFVAAVTRWLSAPQTRHLLDESALVPPEPAGVSALPVSAATEEAAEPMTGTPGYVVPGVSDMGLDGLSTVTYGGVANVDPSATPEASDAHAIQIAAETDSSPETLLPEAGDAEPADTAERQAREEQYPPFEPVDNIADVTVTTTETAVTTPDVAVETPSNAVETAEESVETPENVVATLSDDVETPENVVTAADSQDTAEPDEPIAPRPPNPTQPRRSTSHSQPSQSARSAPREPGARMEGRSSKTNKSGGKSTASKASGEGSNTGKRHSSRKSHK